MKSDIQKLVIIGGGGHAQVVLDALNDIPGMQSSLQVMGFLDDTPRDAIWGIPYFGPISNWKQFTDVKFHIALGNPRLRANLCSEITAERLVTVVHSKASVSRYASLASGCYVGPCAVVSPGASLGIAVIVNSGAIVEHSASVGDFAHLSYGAIVGAEAIIPALETVTAGFVVPSRAVFGGR